MTRSHKAGGPSVRAARRRGDTIAIAYLHPGQVSAYFTESLLATILVDVAAEASGARPRRIVNVLQEWSSANVSGSRNSVTRRFLASGVGDWLLWVDSDMQWSPEAIDDLIAAADPAERPIVGGLCFGMADGRMWPTIYQWVDSPDGPATGRVGAYPSDTLVRCAATGAAFLLVHRDALQKIADRGFSAAFPWFQETELGGKPVGEDLTFCIRAGLCGIPVHVHTGVRIGHHKSQLLTEEGFLAQPEPEGA